MSIVRDAIKSVEDRTTAIAGVEQRDKEFVAIASGMEDTARKILSGYVDDPELIGELIEAAQACAANTAHAMLLTGPRGAMDTLSVSNVQNFLLGILIGKSLA